MERILLHPSPATLTSLPLSPSNPRVYHPALGRLHTHAKARDSVDSFQHSASGKFWEHDENQEIRALVHVKKEEEDGLILHSNPSFQTLSQDMAMGLILRAATGTGWTTGSGLEGPSNALNSFDDENEGHPWPALSKSPRRRMRVAFTCNVCGKRTTRAINPHAYTDGTVFVQCGGCNVFHKLVDNLKLFHELQGNVFPTTVSYGHEGFADHQSYDILGLDDFPVL